MAVIHSAWILMILSLFGMAQAFYPIRPPCLPAFSPPPRHEPSCRDTIEDLKALLEITQAMQPNQGYTCPSCSTTFSEEIISKLVNALIYTATQNCGVSNVGGGGGNTGVVSGGSGNSGGLTGGLIGGGNRRNNGEGLIQLGLLDGQDTAHLDLGGQKVLGVDLGQQSGSGGVGGLRGGGGGRPSNGNGSGRPISGGNTGVMQSPNRGSNGEGLIQVGLLDGQDTAHVDLGGQKLLGVDLGPQSGSGGSAGGLLGGGGGSNDGLINLGLLNGGNDLLDLGLGGKKLLGVDLGQTVGGVTGGLTGNPSGSSNPRPISQPSQPNIINRMNNSPNSVPMNNNVNQATTPVTVENVIYNSNGGSQVPGNSGSLTDDYNGFEGMQAMPVIGD